MSQDFNIDVYMSSIENHLILSKEEEYELAMLAKQGNLQARNKLISSNLKFVVQVAHKFAGYTTSGKITLIDIIQEGNAGLIKAVEKFEPEKGFKFISYASWWIRAYIQTYIIKQFSLVKMGTTTNQRKLFFKLGKLRDIREEKDPDAAEILRQELANETNLTVEQITQIGERLYARDMSISSSRVNERGEDMFFEDMLASHNTDFENMETKNSVDYLSLVLGDAIKTLNNREQLIVKDRFLIEEKRTLANLGQELGISRERVRQIEAKALITLKRVITDKDNKITDHIG